MRTDDPMRRDQVRNPEVVYERRGMNVRMVLLVGFVMIMLAVLIHFSVAGLFNHFRQGYASADPKPNAILSREPARKPPDPRLQPDPVADMSKFRRAEDDVLQSYGWVDKNTGVVRIPVSRALELAATRGIPGLKSAAPAPAPTDSPAKNAATKGEK